MSATDEVLAAAADLVAAFARHDTAGYFRYFAPDATFIFYTVPSRLTSKAEYERVWRHWEQEDGFRVVSCESSGQAVQDLGAVAIFSHDLLTVVRSTAGEHTTLERETIVFRRDGRRWLAVHEHLSLQPGGRWPL